MAERRDAGRLADIHVASWMDTYRATFDPRTLARTTVSRSRTRFHLALSRRHGAHGIAVLEHLPTGQLWGYVTVGRQRLDRYPYRGEIFELYVDPMYQGRGAGRRLLSAGIWTLVNHGLNPVMLWVLEDNTAARRFYERCGGLLFASGDARVGDELHTTAAYGWPATLPIPMD